MTLAAATPITFVLTLDRAKSLPFYRDVLDLELVREDDFAAVFALGGGAILRLTDMREHTPSQHTVLGWRVPDIASAMADLQRKGVSFLVYPGLTDETGIWTAPGGVARVAWFNDPDGNNLSLTQD